MHKASLRRKRSGEDMGTSFDYLQDDYALALLTEAAIQTNHTPTAPSYERSTPSRGTLPSITNHQEEISPDQHLNAAQLRNSTPDHLGGFTSFAPTSRTLDTMSFNQSNSILTRQLPYMDAHFRGIGTEISSNYTSNLGILNAVSYDDGSNAMSIRQMASMRLKQQQQPELPFGITDHPRIQMDDERRTESDEQGKGKKRGRKHRLADDDDALAVDEEEEARKKARGRPRVDTKDETAADRRRTQIRMAQRAYRSRKETTITSLEKQVQDLRGTNEEMSNIFIGLYDFAVGRGLLQREPEFAHQLQSTTERFLALAKASGNDDDSTEESHMQQSIQHKEPEPASRKNTSRVTTKKIQNDIPQELEPVVQPWGGYTVTKDDCPMEEVSSLFIQQACQDKPHHNDVQIITRPTEDNASFPFDFTDLQQYRVELPASESFSQAFLPLIQLPLPETHSYHEISFARRIQRGSMERAIMLLTLEHPPEQRFQEAFGFTLMYNSKEDLLAKMKGALTASSKETLHDWSMPFLHTGGSGTYYPMHDSEVDRELMPKLRTGYSMGPCTPRVGEVHDAIQDDLRCNVPGFGGDFFDSNDVEGYLRGRGLEIPTAADYVNAEIDFSEIFCPRNATSSESALESLSPVTPQSPAERGFGETAPYTYDFSKPEEKAFPFPLDFANWDRNATTQGVSNIDPIFSTVPVRDADGAMNGFMKKSVVSERRLVTINVKVLLDEILKRGVCLGRAPGFRPSDVNASIITAIKAGYSG